MTNLELFVHVGIATTVCIAASRLVGSFMVYMKQPRVVGEMIAGVLLGPSLFGKLAPELSAAVFLPEVKSSLFVLSNFGLSFYMFLVGAEIDYSLFNKKTIQRSSILSLFGTFVPFGLGIVSGLIYKDQLAMPGISSFAICFFMGTALAITAFPMLARILQEKNIVNTEIGVLSLLSASIMDVISWILLAFVTVQAAGKESSEAWFTVIGAFVFIILILFVAKPLYKWIGKKTEEAGHLHQTHFAIVIIGLIIAALFTDKLGLYSVFGGFILGLVMPRTPVFQREIKVKMYDFMIVFLLPLFFTFSGLNTDLFKVITPGILIPALVIVLFSFIGKYVTVALTMKATGYSWRDSSAIGGLINARGLMELIIANIGLSYAVIPVSTFTILVIIAIVSTLGAMPIYYLSLGKQKAA